jgi:hypothetical protein
VALVCLNLALIAAVVFHAGGEPAYAQRGRGGHYTLITARKDSNEDIVFVVDVNNRIMRSWLLDKERGKLVWRDAGVRFLDRDFPVGTR